MAPGVGGSYEQSALRGAIVWLVAVKLAALILVLDADGLNTFAVPKVLVSRAFAWLLAGLVVVTVLRYGPSVIPRTRLHAAVAAYVLVVSASAAFAADPYTALYGQWARGLGLTFVFDMTTLYLAVAIAVRTEPDRLILFRTVGAATLGAIAYASAQYAGLDPVAWTPDPRVRPFGTLGNANPFAHLLAVAASASLALAVFATRPGLRWAAAGVGATAVLAATLVATRAVLVGLGAGALGILGVWLAAHRGPPARELRRPVAVAVVALSLVGLAAAITPLGMRLADTLRGQGVLDRVVIYESALRSAADRPILGWGPDGYAIVALRYLRPGTEAALYQERPDNAHNWALQAAGSTGVAGLAALLAVVVATTILLWRQRRSATIAAILVASVSYWAQGLLSVGSAGIDWVPWVAAGTAAAGRAAWWPHQRPSGVRARAIAGAVVLGAGLGASSVIPAFAANAAGGESLKLLRAGAIAPAFAAARSATALDGGPSAYWMQLGRTEQAAGADHAAVDAYAQAASRAPWDPLPWQLLAAAHAGLASRERSAGDRTAALEAATKGIEMDPNRSRAYINFAQVAYAVDDDRAALRAAARAIELYPADAGYDVVAARAAARLEDAQARETLRALIRLKDSEVLRRALARLDQLFVDR